MTLFRVLSDDEAQAVKRWQAPVFSGNNRSTREALVVDATHQGGQQGLDKQAAADELPDSDIRVGSLDAAMSQPGSSLSNTNPSAEMLQSSYDEGYAVGFAEGGSAAQQRINEQLGDMLNALSPRRHLQDAELATEIVALARAMARMILHREVSANAAVMLDFVDEALKLLHADAQLPSVHLHPLDAVRVRALLSDEPAIRLIDDVTVARGGCVIESGASTIRTGVDDQIDRMISSLYTDESAPAGADTSASCLPPKPV